jgi:hypothetical protein
VEDHVDIEPVPAEQAAGVGSTNHRADRQHHAVDESAVQHLLRGRAQEAVVIDGADAPCDLDAQVQHRIGGGNEVLNVQHAVGDIGYEDALPEGRRIDARGAGPRSLPRRGLAILVRVDYVSHRLDGPGKLPARDRVTEE